MLVGFLKHNRSLSIIVLPILIIALWIYGFFHLTAPSIEHSAALYKLVINSVGKYPLLITTISFLMIFSEALLINYIIRENEIIHTTSYLPGVIYMILMSLQPEMYSFHPIVVANLFMLLALHVLIQTYRKETSYSKSFDTGFFIAMASLFYIPSIIFVPLLWIGLITLKPFIWRDWIISLMGIMVPWLFIIFYYFWIDDMATLQKDVLYYTLIAPQKSFANIRFSLPEAIQLGVLLISSFFAFTHLLLYSSGKSSMRTRSNNIIMMAFFILSIISIFLAPYYSISHLSFLAIPFTAFFSNYLLAAKKQWIAETLLLLLIISVFLNQYIN
jgi:hypothetical protein